MKLSHPLGRLGESLATSFLQKKGYKIIQRNFSIRGGEVDIIAIKSNILVFIEVKTRISTQFGTPLEAITPWKLQSLTKTALVFKASHPQLPNELRIDAVSVLLNADKTLISIEHTENISGF